MESNHGKVVVAAALSNKSAPLMKKEFSCKYCNKKFSSYQALGGHHNAHKAEREAEKQNKILSNASAYYKKSFVGSNSGSQSQPNHIHTFMTGGSASHQQYKSHQPLISSTVGEGPTNSGSKPHSSHPSLCDKGNFGQATASSMIHQKAIIEGSDLNVKTSRDLLNSAQENSSCSVNGAVENLDLTLRLRSPNLF
ncbi:hypothetical protein JHK82_021847 [Glycine max]|nr:hypothetical protein JHK82_021847 [Glycine max]